MFPIYSILAQAAPEAQTRLLPGWAFLLIAVAIVGLPFVFGSMLARGLKMKEYALKFSLVLLAFFMGVAPFASQYVFGYVEQKNHEQAVETFKEKERDYEGITTKGIEGLEKKIGLQVIRREAAPKQ